MAASGSRRPPFANACFFPAAAAYAAIAVPSLHAIAIGALGTLTVTVMARTRMLFRFGDPNRFARAHVAAGLVGIAALLRLVPGSGAYWTLASAIWARAFVLLIDVLRGTLVAAA